jgi:hypothetical protein
MMLAFCSSVSRFEEARCRFPTVIITGAIIEMEAMQSKMRAYSEHNSEPDRTNNTAIA